MSAQNDSAISWTMLVLFALLAFRNELVHRAFIRRLYEIHVHNAHAITRGAMDELVEYPITWQAYWIALFDLRAWSYRQFFPAALAEVAA